MPEIKSHGKLFFDKIVRRQSLTQASERPASRSEIVSPLGNNPTQILAVDHASGRGQ